jgi:tetratricopeptide (TPR) repeat protein
MDYLDNFNVFNDEDTRENPLVMRFEAMINDGRSSYFGAEDFEEIIEHYLENMEGEKAEHAAKIALLRYPQDEQFMLMQAVALLETNRYDEAMAVSRRLEKIAPDNLEALHVRAIATLAAGKTSKGLSLVDKALQRADNDMQKLHILAPAVEFLQKTQMYDDALKYAHKLYAIMPANEEVMLLMARCHKDCGNMENSIRYYESYLKKHDKDYVWLELGRTYEKNEQRREALKIYNKVIKRYPDNVQAYWHKAAYYSAANKMKEVIKVHDALLSKQPDFVPAWYTKGRCYADLNDTQEAMKCYYKVLELEPYHADTYFAMAMQMMAEKKPRHQVEYIQRALSIDPYNQNYYLCYASAHAAAGRMEDAERLLDHCLQISDEFSPAWLLLADIRSINGYDSAIDTLKEAQKRMPDNMRIVCHLAVMYYKSQNMPACWEHVRRLLQSNPMAAIDFLRQCPGASINAEFLELLKNISVNKSF